MGKKLDKDMMRMMTVSERFEYMAAKKKMKMSMINSGREWDWMDNTTCSYSGLPSMEVYKDEPITSSQDDWVDRDESDWDSSSDGSRKRVDDSYDDSNEY